MALSQESWGLIMALLSAVFFASQGVFVKRVCDAGVPSTELVLFQTIFQGFFVVLGMLFLFEEPLKKSPQVKTEITYGSTSNDDESDNCDSEDNVLLIKVPFGRSALQKKIVIARGIIGGGLGFLCKIYAIKTLPLGDAVTLFSLYPIYTIIFASIYLNEPMTFKRMMISIIGVVGGVLIAGPSFLSKRGDPTLIMEQEYNPWGYAAALIGSLLQTSVIILIRKAGTVGVDTLQLLFSWSVFGTIGAIFFGLTVGSALEGAWFAITGQELWLNIFYTCALGLLSHGLKNYAGRICQAGLFSIVRSSNILWSYILEVFVFHEVPTMTTLAGVVLVVISMMMIVYEKIKAEKKRQELKKEYEAKPLLESNSTFVSDLETDGESKGSGTSLENLDTK